MSDKAQPFTKEERGIIVNLVKAVWQCRHTPGLGIDGACATEAMETLRWAATVAQAEAERDELRDEVRELKELLAASVTF